MRITTAVIITFALYSVAAASAKCSFAKYTIEGSVSAPAGVDINKVRVYVFLDGTDRVSDYVDSDTPESFRVEPDGTFRAEAWLSTDSGWSRATGDKCIRVETQGELILLSDEIQAKRVRISFNQSTKEILKHLRVATRVPAIELEARPRL